MSDAIVNEFALYASVRDIEAEAEIRAPVFVRPMNSLVEGAPLDVITLVHSILSQLLPISVTEMSAGGDPSSTAIRYFIGRNITWTETRTFAHIAQAMTSDDII